MDFSKETKDVEGEGEGEIEAEPTIWIERRGRKATTYITGLKGSDSEQKKLAKALKHHCHCNGCFKSGKFTFTGDHKEIMIEFLVNKYGVNRDDIKSSGI